MGAESGTRAARQRRAALTLDRDSGQRDLDVIDRDVVRTTREDEAVRGG